MNDKIMCRKCSIPIQDEFNESCICGHEYTKFITMYLPEWFLKNNNLNRLSKALDVFIIKQSEKAFHVKIHPVIALYHNHNGKIWIPKSIIIKIIM